MGNHHTKKPLHCCNGFYNFDKFPNYNGTYYPLKFKNQSCHFRIKFGTNSFDFKGFYRKAKFKTKIKKQHF